MVRRAERAIPLWTTWVASALVTAAASAHGPCDDGAPWNRLPESAQQFAQPLPLGLVAGAAASPFLLGPTGADHELRVLLQDRLDGSYHPEPVTVLAPYVLAGGLLVGWTASASFGACELQRPQAAMLQSVLLTAGTVALLKVATGRTWPNGGQDPQASDRLDHPQWATTYRPWRSGLAAWPSGHTAVMVAAAAALRTSAPELGFVGWLGYPLAAGVAAGMAWGDHHWTSDILSGALLGEAIGGSVGRSFAPRVEGIALDDLQPTVSLIPQPGGGLLTCSGVW